jgi:hypothetical protein
MLKVYRDWNFPETQFINEKTFKWQIVLHHTVSGDGVDGDVAWWLSTPDRIATSFIIARDGKLHKCFSDDCWGYHIGCRQAHFEAMGLPFICLDKFSIGIELDSWGPLLKHTDGKFYPITTMNGKQVPNTTTKPVRNIYEYCTSQQYKGHQYYERYTTNQLSTLGELLEYLMAKHSIQANYRSDIWNPSRRAMTGEEGIFSHTSFRPDKSDAHPQAELVNLLKSLQ